MLVSSSSFMHSCQGIAQENNEDAENKGALKSYSKSEWKQTKEKLKKKSAKQINKERAIKMQPFRFFYRLKQRDLW